MKHTINNNIISIIFDENEVKYMVQMLEAKLEEELEEVVKFNEEIKKAIENKDIDKMRELERDAHCLFAPHLVRETITKLEDTNELSTNLNLLRYNYVNKLKLVKDRNFVNNFKELIRIAIEHEEFDCLKSIFLRELAEI